MDQPSRGRLIRNLSWKTRQKEIMEGPGINMGLILRNINLEEICRESVDWINLPHNRVQWLNLAKTEMNLCVRYKSGNVLTNSAVQCIRNGLAA